LLLGLDTDKRALAGAHLPSRCPIFPAALLGVLGLQARTLHQPILWVGI